MTRNRPSNLSSFDDAQQRVIEQIFELLNQNVPPTKAGERIIIRSGGAGGGGVSIADWSDFTGSVSESTAALRITKRIDLIKILDAEGVLTRRRYERIATITNADSPYTIGSFSLVLADASAGPVTVNLPVASPELQRRIEIVKTDETQNPVTLTPQAPETIAGLPDYPIYANGGYVVITSSGGNWIV